MRLTGSCSPRAVDVAHVGRRTRRRTSGRSRRTRSTAGVFDLRLRERRAPCDSRAAARTSAPRRRPSSGAPGLSERNQRRRCRRGPSRARRPRSRPASAAAEPEPAPAWMPALERESEGSARRRLCARRRRQSLRHRPAWSTRSTDAARPASACDSPHQVLQDFGLWDLGTLGRRLTPVRLSPDALHRNPLRRAAPRAAARTSPPPPRRSRARTRSSPAGSASAAPRPGCAPAGTRARRRAAVLATSSCSSSRAAS